MAEIWPGHRTADQQADTPLDIEHRPSATDPSRDGLIGMYALRILDRGVDPRALVAEHRATRYGLGDRVHRRQATRLAEPSPVAVGRGALIANQAPTVRAAVAVEQPARSARPARVRRLGLPSLQSLSGQVFGTPALPGRNPRRLVTAGFALAAILGIGVMGAFAQELPAQQLYVVQEGDSLETVAATFGVDPEAILAASGVQNPPQLIPNEVVVIPAPDQTPEEAAIMAAELGDARPYVIGAYALGEGETLGDVASWFQMPVETLASFNGISDPDALAVGQRLLIPSPAPETAEAFSAEAAAPETELAAFEQAVPAAESVQLIEAAQTADLAPVQDVATAPGTTVPGLAPYHQEYTLSSAFASGFIATSAFGAGVPESVFVDSIPLSPNPHWGYRGNLNGDWGNTTDYGVYAEPLVPVLNANGFNAEVFYSGGDPAALRAYLDGGSPVIAWLGFYGDTAYAVEDDGAYTLAPGMHTVVVYGYDEYGVQVADPANGSLDYYSWDDFLSMWSILDGMGLAVAPW